MVSLAPFLVPPQFFHHGLGRHSMYPDLWQTGLPFAHYFFSLHKAAINLKLSACFGKETVQARLSDQKNSSCHNRRDRKRFWSGFQNSKGFEGEKRELASFWMEGLEPYLKGCPCKEEKPKNFELHRSRLFVLQVIFSPSPRPHRL